MSAVPEIRLFCGDYHDRITPAIREYIEYCSERLEIKRPHMLAFVDGEDPRYNDGFHEWGPNESLILVRLWDKTSMPDDALMWLIAHEMRHLWQSEHDLFPTDEEDERDADEFATAFTGYDGVAWWDDFKVIQCKRMTD